MAADGSIVIEANVDAKRAQTELNRLARKIDNINDQIEGKNRKRSYLVEQAEQIQAAYRDAVAGNHDELAESLAKQYDKVQTAIGRIDGQLKDHNITLEIAQEKAGGYAAQLAGASESVEETGEKTAELPEQFDDAGAAGEDAGNRISDAMRQATARIEKLGKRITGMIKRVFFFSLFTRALRGVRSWFSDIIKSNDEASAAIARLKAALLTLAQPLVNVIVPAFTALVNVLTSVVNAISSLLSKLFGTTIQQSAEAAENLYDEQKAIKGVGSAAKKASKQLAAFDQINKLTSDDASGGSAGGIDPDFEGNKNSKWFDTYFEGIEDKVTAALLLGGVVLIAIGAGTLNLGLVLAGLALLGAGIVYGNETGVIGNWAEVLGLEKAEQLITAALLVAGMAALVIGIITGNILLFFAGAALIGAGLYYGEESGVLDEWAQKLGLERAEELVTAALLVAGIAAVVIGIITGSIPLFIAGALMIGAAIVYGGENEVFSDWAEKLGLDSVFDYVVVAIQLLGIALIAIGAAMGNIAMIIAGSVILAVGIAAEQIGEEQLKDWWEVLKLTKVQQWVGVVTMLAGIALIGIGVAMSNIFMILGGMALVGIATATNAAEGNLKDWVTVLGLEKVAGWVTAALLLGGIALIVIGILTANIPMVLAGLGMLGAGVSVGITSGTFESWLGTISGAFLRFKETIVNTFSQLWDGVKNFINSILGGIESLANGVVRGINKVIDAINSVQFTVPDWIPGLGGYSVGFNLKKLEEISIPRLAQGAVIPPNREFMAVLGDQKHGTNIEAPLETIVAAFKQAMGESRGQDIQVKVYLDSREIKAGQQRLSRVMGV